MIEEEPEELELLFIAIAKFDYEAEDDTEISFEGGDEINVYKISDNGWWFAESMDGQCGWAPSNFLERDDELAHSSTISSGSEFLEDVWDPFPDLSLAEDGEGCQRCGKVIEDSFVMALGRQLHPECFCCVMCGSDLAEIGFIENEGALYCEEDYHNVFSPRCGHCEMPITSKYITALGQCWHPEHFVCAICEQPFPQGEFRKFDEKPYCEKHFEELFAERCGRCSKPVLGQAFEAMDRTFHPECFICENGHVIGDGQDYHEHDDKLYCTEHFRDMFFEKCHYCKKLVEEEYVTVLGKNFHLDCFICVQCKKSVADGKFDFFHDDLLCRPHAKQKKLQGDAPDRTNLPKAPHDDPKIRKRSSRRKSTRISFATDEKTSEDAIRPPNKASRHRFGSLRKKTASLCDEDGKQDKEIDEEQAIEDTINAIAAAFSGFPATDSDYYTLDQLRSGDYPVSVDARKKEVYLSPEDFDNTFGMALEQFYGLPQWKQTRLKKALNLF